MQLFRRVWKTFSTVILLILNINWIQLFYMAVYCGFALALQGDRYVLIFPGQTKVMLPLHKNVGLHVFKYPLLHDGAVRFLVHKKSF